MDSLSDKQLLRELRLRLEERKTFEEKYNGLFSEYQLLGKRLKESEALKSHFISNITNEIVNPFSSIIGLSKSILSVEKQDWKKIVTMVAMIHSEAFNLDFQLKNIFTAAKIEAGEVQPNISKVNVKSLVQTVIDSFLVVARKMGIEIEFDYRIEFGFGKNFYYKTDSEKLKQILTNIINNAVKYSYKESKVIVSMWVEDDVLNISVQDFGTGISEKNQNLIFERFKRLDTGINSINQGHGLGLSITKSLLDLLNGTISIKSKKGEGTTFTISLPESSAVVNDLTDDDGGFFVDDGDELF
ncbi:MAG: HAMP domain-containing histidine kinase [Bacteroidales bacterium]|jgi:signal transduction histidine kinase|nr:HAMP domain-containing histidine kinase [Bacteroidales bacterium]MBP5419593.1 HAMP domain-containing histidine kinase [Bacteroidales bacterium]MCR5697442.1 HAMP domain-containing histidine kinase [Marinilabiliaceae bacterium]